MHGYLAHCGFPDTSWDVPSIALASARGFYLEALSGASPDDLRRRYALVLRLPVREFNTE